jgi:hypothetical protein
MVDETKSKAQAVQDYLADHPRSKRQQVIEALKKGGIDVDGPYVSSIKYQAKKKRSAKKRIRVTSRTDTGARHRRTPLFPASAFKEALTIPNAIQKHASGQKVRRLTLFDQLTKSPDSGASHQMIVNANKYGLTKGNYTAEFLELTTEGALATSSDAPPKERLTARFNLAIKNIPVFNALYESQKGNRLPAPSVLEDLAKENGISPEDAKECVETFIVNAKFLGILRTLAGAERVIPIEQALEEIPETPELTVVDTPAIIEGTTAVTTRPVKLGELDTVCFYISPIGEEDSDRRMHSDLFLGSLIEPALEEFGLKVIRADKIGKPGMITAQILEYILKSKLVIADLSFHNPNVFYELSLRHACRLPTVQVIRKADKIPFDLDQFRTIQIDMTSVFTMVPNLQTYKAEIATQVRLALKDPDSVDNPISTYYPKLKVTF